MNEQDNETFYFDIDRMEKAINSSFVSLHTGLSAEEIDEFLMNI